MLTSRFCLALVGTVLRIGAGPGGALTPAPPLPHAGVVLCTRCDPVGEPSWALSPQGEELRVSLPPHVSAEEARTLVAVRLFELGRISRGKAAELAGLPLREFLNVLTASGVPLIDYEPAELAAELDG